MIVATYGIRIGNEPLAVEVARTAEERSLGLMYRHSLPDDRGMLFIWKVPQKVDIWMMNCYVPLDAAFFDNRRKLLTVRSLQAYNPEEGIERASSEKNVKYVVEAPLGWFLSKGLVDSEGEPEGIVLLDLPPVVRDLEDQAD